MTQTTLAHYVLGLAGLGLLRDWWSGDAVTEQRLQRLVELAGVASSDDLLSLPLAATEHDMVAGYTKWSETYDGPNPLIETDDKVTATRLETIAALQPGGVALDAGCGTGRKAAALVELGYEVIGTDLTPAMLAIARDKLPQAEFREGPFEALPVDDDAVDLIVSSLAVCHASDLRPVFSEFARVLKPGGQIVISDPHPSLAGFLGGQAFFRDGADLPFVRNQGRPISEYFDAASRAGLHVTAIEEHPMNDAAIASNPIAQLYPDVAESAFVGLPWLLVIAAQAPS